LITLIDHQNRKDFIAFVRPICRNSRKLATAWLLLAVCVGGSLAVGRIGPTPDSGHALAQPAAFAFAFVIVQGLLSPLLAALTLVLTSTQKAGAAGLAARLLSSRAFTWLAPITYEIYLIHPMVSKCIAWRHFQRFTLN
jgi:peptidoglycan/LPS O-acetylase OafA/YrhL